MLCQFPDQESDMVIKVEFLHLFVRYHCMVKPLVVSQSIDSFLRPGQNKVMHFRLLIILPDIQ